MVCMCYIFKYKLHIREKSNYSKTNMLLGTNEKTIIKNKPHII